MDSVPNALEHLLTSNTAPRPTEVASITHGIEDLTNAIKDVKAQLQGKLQHLECQRQRYRFLLSPLRRMPLEVLGEIFTAVLTEVGEYGRVDKALINLCLVCRAWCDAAFATPRLWSGLVMDGIPSFFPLETAVRWFGRCRGVPSTLRILGDEHRDCTSPDGCDFANLSLAKLLTEGPKLHRVILYFTSSQCFRNLFNLMETLKTGKPRTWDSIHLLDLFFYHEWNEPLEPSDTIFSHIPSSVTSFHLALPWSYTFRRVGRRMHLPFPGHVLANLTNFTLDCDWDGEAICKVLQLCTNVEVLTLDHRFCRIYFQDTPFLAQMFREGVLLPKLRTLRLRTFQPAGVDFILLLRVPSLVEFDISFNEHESSPNHHVDMADPAVDLGPSLIALVQKSQCQNTFRKLRIHSIKITKEQLMNIVLAFPLLTHLILDNLWFDGTVLYDLSTTSPKPLPHLEVLELLALPADFALGDLEHFVMSRQEYEIEDGQRVDLDCDSLKKIVVTCLECEPFNFQHYGNGGFWGETQIVASLGLVKRWCT